VRVLANRERLAEELLGAAEVARVDERMAEQDHELDAAQGVVVALGALEAALEDGDRGLELAHHGVGAAEGVGQVRVLGLRRPVERERALEVLDGEAWIAAPVGDLAEAFVSARAESVRRGVLQEVGVEALRVLEVLQAEGDLGFQERAAGVAAAVLRARREPVLGDPEPAAELAQQLEGRNAVPGLDA
jgi:hypothetical protein